MIKELLEGLTSRLKGVGERGAALPPAGGIPAPSSAPVPTAPADPAPVPPAPSTDDFSALLGGGDTSELDNKVKALEDKTTKLESTVRETLELTKANKSRLDSIDTNMKKFLSLYELVTNQINPFVDSKQPFRKVAMEVNGKSSPEPEEGDDKIIMPTAEELEKSERKPQAAKAKKAPEAPKLALPEEPKLAVPEEDEEPEPPKMAAPKKAEPRAEAISDKEQVMFMQSLKDGNASFVMEWITSLVSEDGGVEKNTKLLKYLLNLGWITPKAYDALMMHMQTIAQAGKAAEQQEQKVPLAVGVPYGQGMPQGFRQPEPRPMQIPGMPTGPGNNMDSLVTVLEWVKYLVDTAGYKEAEDILKYLVQLGWITPDAHEALIRYIEKSTPQGALTMPKPSAPGMFMPQRREVKPESKVMMSPNRIPTPEDFMRSEYRVPIQPTSQMPTPIQPQYQFQVPQAPPQPQYQVPYRGEYGQYSPLPQRPEPRKPAASAIIPLTEIGSDIDSLAIILEWIRYLVDRAGTQGTKEVFEYYLNIGWVDKKVCQQLVKYVEGIKAKEEETVGYQPTVEDHATSLFFISKLKHLDLSEEEINSMLGK